MIIYDPHHVTAFLRLRGSVFPRAFWYALPSAILALTLKLLNDEGKIDLQDFDVSQGQGIYQGFTYVLGFVLAFRASQSYARYWASARATHSMGAEWFDSAGSLIAFAQSSDAPEEEVALFSHTVVRLFCILHAMALEEIADLSHDRFLLLDSEGMDKEDLRILTRADSQGRKVEIVSQWIKAHILNAMKSKVLVVPPPIITRVFQQLGTGLVHYHDVLHVVIWPFPFPYAQMTFILLLIYALLTPLIIAQNSKYPQSAFALTLISIICMKGIELIAAELENPFGNDCNDLPTHEMHHEMTQDLICLVDPTTFRVPRLLPAAKMTHELLMEDANERHEELMEFQRQRSQRGHSPLNWFTKKGSATELKSHKMKSWMSQRWPDATSSVGGLLNIDGEYAEGAKSFTASTIGMGQIGLPQKCLGQTGLGQTGLGQTGPTKAANEADTKEIKVAPSKTEESGTIREVLQQPSEPPLQDFLLELTKTMQLFFSQQTEILRTGSDKQLGAIQEVLQQLQQSAGHQVIHQTTPLPYGFGEQPGAFEPRSRFESDVLAVPPKATSMPFCCQLAPAHPKPRQKPGERRESHKRDH